MLVCHCHEVSDRTLRQCIRAGARTVSEIGAACGAGTSCGGCRPTINALITEIGVPRMTAGSIAAGMDGCDGCVEQHVETETSASAAT